MQNQTETRLNMSIHSSIVLQALQGGVSFLRLRETFSPCSSGFAWRSHLRMGFPKNHHHTMGPSGCVKVSRGAGCCCAPWGGTSGSGRARWVLPLPVHTLFLCQLKHYFSLSQAPATTLNLKACFGVICAGWRVTYCKHYIWLSPGGLLGKESNSRSSNLGDSTKHRLFVKCQMTVTSGGKAGLLGLSLSMRIWSIFTCLLSSGQEIILPVLQHGCSCSLTDVGLRGCASYVLNSLCNRTAEDGNGFLVDVPCVLVNVRTLPVLSCSGCPSELCWSLFWDAGAIANKW